MSNTKLGLQGPRRPPIRFDENNREVGDPGEARRWQDLGGYWADEQAVGIDGIAKRSLALGVLAPLLRFCKPNRFMVRELVADNCDLSDHDAKGIAAILQAPPTTDEQEKCVLEVLSLRNNWITNIGANALKKAVKYNKNICEIRLEGNRDISDFDILRTLEKRLAANRN
jgi:hypothetical protein